MAEYKSLSSDDFDMTLAGHRLFGIVFSWMWWDPNEPADEPEVTKSELLCAVLLYGEGVKKIASHKGPPTLIVNDRGFVLPEDGMCYVVDRSIRPQQLDLSAEVIEQHLEADTLDKLVTSGDWITKVQPVLEAHMWKEDGRIGRNGKRETKNDEGLDGKSDQGEKPA